jgi:nitrogen fixation NifU-like protein
MSLMEQIYKQVILERSRRPRHQGSLPDADVRQEGVNPSCGDELTLTLKVEGDRIVDAAFEGHGCAISQASADLMAEALRGRSRAEARQLADAFKGMIRGEPIPEGIELGDLKALEGIRRLHARVKCATLPWTTLETALAGGGGVASDEADA